jgi:hypothetical protein
MDQDGQYHLRSPHRGKPQAAQELLLEMLARAQLPAAAASAVSVKVEAEG